MAKFYICELCGNMVDLIKEKGGTVACCGQDMKYLEPNTVEAAQEKHLPEVTKTANGIKVQVGSVLHPMEDAHYIDFVYVKTEKGSSRIGFKAGDSPVAEFSFAGDTPKEAYAYCNLHGMWKIDIK